MVEMLEIAGGIILAVIVLALLWAAAVGLAYRAELRELNRLKGRSRRL